MRKRMLLVILLVFTNTAFAEEDVGFIKRLWRNILHRPKIEKKEEEVLPLEKGLEEEKVVETKTEPTKEQKIETIRDNLSIYGDEIIAKIPQLVKDTDAKGDVVYKIKKESGEIVNLEDLDEEAITALYHRVTNESVAIRTEEINRQIQQQMQQLRHIQQPPTPQLPPRPPEPPPQPPRTYTPPRIPSAPPPVPQTQRK